ncbi:MAG: carbamoyltransferase HypF [Hyphomicrobiales bacterium]|nr:carbamoyltransferase HypF [Hyphomicrobiales bacterium]
MLQGLPYDRARTTMAAFPMCEDCRSEYENPADRRFHAQPVACPVCGPRIWLETSDKRTQTDVVARAAALLLEGKVLAIKGLGGFHLACDATNGEAVDQLRVRKRRPAKPFALMGTLAMIAGHCTLTPEARTLLEDPAAPVVLMPSLGNLPPGVAPGMDELGFMLPYTPLHALLLEAVARPLVMTSGNLSGEPQVIGNDEARQKLAAFADAFVMHDRDIARRLDDGVERPAQRGPMTLRRARGRAPSTFTLPPGFGDAPQVVAFGGHLKAAICLVKNGEALLSHHLGDLDNTLSIEEFEKAVRDYAALFDHKPALAACDLHEAYHSSRHSSRFAASLDLPLEKIQHHHAHLASAIGEHGWPLSGGPVAGIVLDGLGLGSDGAIWGGELLLGDYRRFERIAHLKPLPLAGGEAAQREPWRNAVMRLDDAGLSGLADALFPEKPLAVLRNAAAAGLNAPLSSSAGRLMDATSAILGFGAKAQSFEGEASMRLEAMARRGTLRGPLMPVAGSALDTAPLFRFLAIGLDEAIAPAELAHAVHDSLARSFCVPACALVAAGRAGAVALTGGCFQNAKLTELCLAYLEGVPVITHSQVPANDGGLSFGQALVAAARQLG